MTRNNFINRRLQLACTSAGVALIGTTLLASRATAAGFTPGDLVVYRAGDGSAALSSASAAVFLDEYSPTGTLVQSIAMPTATVSGSTNAFTAAGNAGSEGLLNFSSNGQYLSITGYNTGVNTAAVSSTAPATVNREVDIVSPSTGAITSSTLFNDPTGNIRSASVTNDGQSLYFSSSSVGLRYAPAANGIATASTTSLQLSTGSTNVRNVNITNGQLYISSGSGSIRVASVGTGTPTTSGQTITELPGITTTSPSTSPYQFAFATLGAGATSPDTLYVADNTTSIGLQKYSLVGTSWTLTGSIGALTLEGLTLSVSGTNVNIYTTSGTSILSVTDTSGYDGTLTGTFATLATAATNEAFRGIGYYPSVAAVPEPTTILGGVLLIAAAGWSQRRRLKGKLA